MYRAFHPPIPEFYLVQISFPEAAVACQFPRTDGPAVLLVVSGTGTVRCEDAEYSIGAGMTNLDWRYLPRFILRVHLLCAS